MPSKVGSHGRRFGNCRLFCHGLYIRRGYASILLVVVASLYSFLSLVLAAENFSMSLSPV